MNGHYFQLKMKHKNNQYLQYFLSKHYQFWTNTACLHQTLWYHHLCLLSYRLQSTVNRCQLFHGVNCYEYDIIINVAMVGKRSSQVTLVSGRQTCKAKFGCQVSFQVLLLWHYFHNTMDDGNEQQIFFIMVILQWQHFTFSQCF